CVCDTSISLRFIQDRPPRYLHSFPTRRSSDLLPMERSVALSWSERAGLATVPAIVADHCADPSTPGRAANCARLRMPPRRVPVRSEEHTSELQSPDHLVCRLLLEKKKKKINKE